MKTLLFLLFIFLSSRLYALEYKIDETSLLLPSVSNAYAFKENFEAAGLFSLTNSPLVKNNFLFDFIYTNNHLNQFVTIKSGLVVSDKDLNKIFYDQEKAHYALHLKNNGTYYLMMFFNFSEIELKNLTAPWVKKDTSFSIVSFFISEANASICLADNYTQKSILNLQQTSQKLEDDALSKEISKCAMDTLKGIKNNASETLSLFKTLITNPKKVWNETSESIKAIGSLIKNLNSEIKNITNALTHISPELKSELVCMMAGNAVGVMLASIISGPTAIARNLPLMTLKLKNIAKQINVLESLKIKGVKFKNQDVFFKEVISCEK